MNQIKKTSKNESSPRESSRNIARDSARHSNGNNPLEIANDSPRVNMIQLSTTPNSRNQNKVYPEFSEPI